MTVFEIIGAGIGAVIILTVVWRIVRGGVPESDGKVETVVDTQSTEWLGGP